MKFADWLESSWQFVGFPIKLSSMKDGNLPQWLATLNQLPAIGDVNLKIADIVELHSGQTNINSACIEKAIQSLVPWRKGPFLAFEAMIDSEWRCQLKWQRLCRHIHWSNANVLDIGSGNGYFGFRALGAGAKSVLGLESSMLFVLQAAFINWFARSANIVLPIRFGSVEFDQQFDIVLSMGVVYHQRDGLQHISDLSDVCATNGTLVLESIVADQDFVPEGRYAGMRNVWHVPSVSTLHEHLQNAGFTQMQLVDISTTTIAEQRRTDRMPFRSLGDVLDPSDPSHTIEGYPAPKRAMFIAKRASS